MGTDAFDQLAASINTEQLGYVAVVVVATVIMMMTLRRRSAYRDIQPTERQRPYASDLRDQQHVKQDMETLLVEIQETARQISAQFDTKFAKLDVLLHDADDRINKLERLTARAGRPAVDVTVDDRGAEHNPDTADASPGNGNGHEHIYALADAGKSAVEIARETGKNTGEIELILALRKQTDS
jgi:hypothetical protein